MHLRRRRPRGAGRVLLASAAVVVVLAGQTAAHPAATAATTPDPPLVVPGDDGGGDVRVEPSTQQVTGDRVVWHVRNGGSGTLTFDLAVHAVEAAPEGATIGAPADDLALATPRLTLAAREVARIPLHLPDTSPRAIALVVTTLDTEPEVTVSGMALVGSGDPVTAEIVSADAAAGTFTIRLDAAGPALVDMAVRATAWPGRPTADRKIDGVLVPAGGREVDIRLSGPLAGRVTLDVAVSSAGDVARASQDVWWWSRASLAVVAVALLAASAGLVVLVRRRRA